MRISDPKSRRTSALVFVALTAGTALIGGCNETIRDSDVDWPTGYRSPIAGATFPLAANHLPGAAREYRNGIHQGFDFFNGLVSTPLMAEHPVVAVAPGTVVRIDKGYQEGPPQSRSFFAQRAADDGMVGRFAFDRLRGQQVWIEHEGGYVSRYAHLASVNPELTAGQAVEAGVEVGRVGRSGLPDSETESPPEPHLHFELWNPDGRYLGEDLSALRTHAQIAGVFGDDALPRFARQAVARLHDGESAPESYPPDPLPETAFSVNPPGTLTAGTARSVPVTWDNDAFAVDSFFARLDRAAAGFVDAGNGAWLLLAAPLVREQTPVSLIIGAADRYGQTLVGQSELTIQPLDGPEPMEVAPERYEPAPEETRRAEARRFAALASASLEIRDPLWNEPFRAPAEGTVTRRFGQRVVTGPLRPREPFSGIEIRLDDADDGVRASNAGRVAMVDTLPIRGRTVAIVHGGGIVSVYAGLDAAAVEVGQDVVKGQVIGDAGMADDERRVRWEMQVAGIAVDPVAWVDQLLPTD